MMSRICNSASEDKSIMCCTATPPATCILFQLLFFSLVDDEDSTIVYLAAQLVGINGN
jgi:hypothetical protein